MLTACAASPALPNQATDKVVSVAAVLPQAPLDLKLTTLTTVTATWTAPLISRGGV